SESVESKPKKSLREVQLDQKRVNSAFLDRIEGRGGGVQKNHTQEQETELYLDYDFVLRRLMSDFPQCNRKFLEDIINQCHGDYEQIHSLLS
ncbi:hypothetical protein JOB18_001577, partial [Solea senegalensis]